MKLFHLGKQGGKIGRSPRGECGLKFSVHDISIPHLTSLPSRGVWIEIHTNRKKHYFQASLPSRGVWIEMDCRIPNTNGRWSRSPRGECGLKCSGRRTCKSRLRRSPRGECGLKCFAQPLKLSHNRRSPRGECGLKFGLCFGRSHVTAVAPLAGSVD